MSGKNIIFLVKDQETPPKYIEYYLGIIAKKEDYIFCHENMLGPDGVLLDALSKIGSVAVMLKGEIPDDIYEMSNAMALVVRCTGSHEKSISLFSGVANKLNKAFFVFGVPV